MALRGPLHFETDDDTLPESETYDDVTVLYRGGADYTSQPNSCLAKCTAWIMLLSLVVLALATTFYWKPCQSQYVAKANVTRLQNGRCTVKNMTEPDFVVQERTALGTLGVVYIITIGVLTGICGACCTFFGSAIPGDVPPSPFIRRTQRRTPLTNSPPVHSVVDAMVTTPVNNLSPTTTFSSVVTTVSMERSNSVLLEYIMVPLNVVFIITTVLLWLYYELGVTVV